MRVIGPRGLSTALFAAAMTRLRIVVVFDGLSRLKTEDSWIIRAYAGLTNAKRARRRAYASAADSDQKGPEG